jgi:hypothetical protein
MYADLPVPQANSSLGAVSVQEEGPLVTTAGQADLQELIPSQEQNLFERREKGWVLRRLSPMHKDMCALIAQGVKRGHVAQACGITPEYVTMLLRQPLVLAEIKRMNEYAEVQLDASFGRVVEAIHEGLDSGSTKDKLQAARLQLEVTGRIGSRSQASDPDSKMEDRLLNLSERLVGLLGGARARAGQAPIDAEFTEVNDDPSE